MRNLKPKNITRLKNYKPVTPSLRGRIIPDLSYLDKVLPEKTLKVRTKNHAGRNFTGSITCRHKGGRHPRSLRYIDFNRYQNPKYILSYEYDPNRSALIARCFNSNFKPFYTIAADTNEKKVIDQPFTLPLKKITPGTAIYNVGPYCRSAGSNATLLNVDGKEATIRLPSKITITVSSDLYASIGKASNKNHKLRKQGKAGANR
jgi:large subunit ribosomal protein L2